MPGKVDRSHEWRMHVPANDSWPLVGMQDNPYGERVVSVKIAHYLTVDSKEENVDGFAELHLTLEQSKSIALQLLLHVGAAEGTTAKDALERYVRKINRPSVVADVVPPSPAKLCVRCGSPYKPTGACSKKDCQGGVGEWAPLVRCRMCGVRSIRVGKLYTCPIANCEGSDVDLLQGRTS